MKVEVIIFGIIYCLVFSSYYVTTSFLNIIYSSTAFISFCIFYGLYAVTSLCLSVFSTHFSKFLVPSSEKKKGKLIYFFICLWLSIFTFLIFVGFAPYYLFLLLIGSGVCGVGNAFIWLLQGVFLSSFTSFSEDGYENKNKKDQDISVFYMIYSVNSIIGNLIGLIIILTGISSQNMILYMMIPVFISLLLSFILFVVLKNKVVSFDSVKNDEKSKEKGENVESKRVKIFKVCKLILSMLYQAAALNITYQIIPRGISLLGNTSLITNTTFTNSSSVENTNQNQNQKEIALYNIGTYLAYGVISVISSYFIGKIYNYNSKNNDQEKEGKGGKLLVLSYTILEILDLIGIFLLTSLNENSNQEESKTGNVGWFILLGGVRGYIDMGVNNMLNYELSKYKEKGESSFYFAFYRFLYSMSYLVFSVCIGYVSTPYVLLSCGVLSICSLISYLFYSYSSFSFSNLNFNDYIDFQFENSKICIS